MSRILGTISLASFLLVHGAAFSDGTATTQNVMPAPPLQDAVRISPFPEVSLLVPKGWVSCNPAENALLGNYNLPDELKAKLCNSSQSFDTESKLFYPNAVQLMAVEIKKLDRPEIKSDSFHNMSAKVLSDGIDKVCSMLKASQNLAATDCNLSLGSMSGHDALVGNISGKKAGSSIALLMRVFAVPQNGSLLLGFLVDADTNHATTGPIIDAMTNSVIIN